MSAIRQPAVAGHFYPADAAEITMDEVLANVAAASAGLPALVAGSALPSSVVSMGAERPFGTVRATYEDSEVSVGTGAVDLDLRSMPEDAPARTVHVSVGAGDVDVHLTSGQAVR